MSLVTMLDIESSFSTFFNSLLRASTCCCWRMDVLHRYNRYDLPNQRRRVFMKYGAMPALSSRTRAKILPECEENHLISSLHRSGWTALATEHKTSDILFSVRYFFLPDLLTNTAIGSLSVWPSLFCLQEYFICCSDRAEIRVIVVQNY